MLSDMQLIPEEVCSHSTSRQKTKKLLPDYRNGYNERTMKELVSVLSVLLLYPLFLFFFFLTHSDNATLLFSCF